MQAGKSTQARLLLAKGCENCPTSDDVWLENARMQANPDNAKAVLARGVAAIPNSIKIWLQARSSGLLPRSSKYFCRNDVAYTYVTVHFDYCKRVRIVLWV